MGVNLIKYNGGDEKQEPVLFSESAPQWFTVSVRGEISCDCSSCQSPFRAAVSLNKLIYSVSPEHLIENLPNAHMQPAKQIQFQRYKSPV